MGKHDQSPERKRHREERTSDRDSRRDRDKDRERDRPRGRDDRDGRERERERDEDDRGDDSRRSRHDKDRKSDKESSESRHKRSKKSSSRRSRSRSPSSSEDERRPKEEPVAPAPAAPPPPITEADKEREAQRAAEAAQLEEKVRQRRERVLLWQQQRKAAAEPTAAPAVDGAKQSSWGWEDDEMDEREGAARIRSGDGDGDADGDADGADAADGAEKMAVDGAEPPKSADTSDQASRDDLGRSRSRTRTSHAPSTAEAETAARKGAGAGAGARGRGGAANSGERAAAEDEPDPLDAFMEGVTDEVTKIRQQDAARLRKNASLGITGVFDRTRGERVEDSDSDGEPEPPKDEKEERVIYWNGYTPKQRRELGVADHTKIEYAPFRREFYVEVPEIARMSEAEVAQLRFDLENIRCKGRNCPNPVKSWSQTGIPLKVLEILKRFGFEKPTPIQAQALPAIMAGRDIMGIAKTGSGKTLAFILPMLRHIQDQPPLEPTDGPIAIIVVPTRELALQTYNEARKFSRLMDLRVTCVYGGSNVSDQIADLKRGAEIVVCTPGRMIDMLTANNGKVVNLRRTTYVVLDEADRMFDMGFEPQVMRILDNIRPTRQTVLFSATFPRQMEALARRILQKPIEIQVGGRSVVSDSVTQHVLVLAEEQKFFKLLELIGLYQDQGSIIMFVEKQITADILLKDLMKAGHACLSLHGGIDQQDRDSNLKDFKDGNIRLLVATSVAARGLDVKSLVLVVNYDCPGHYEDYVHRCGRTGRAGNKGTAFTFMTKEDENNSGEIVRALELSGVRVPEELQAMWDKIKATIKQSKKSGFGGKGFKFNELEALQSSQIKMLTMRAHGTDGDDDDYKARERELADEIEDKVAVLMGKKSTGAGDDEENPAPLMLTYIPPNASAPGPTPAAAATAAASAAAAGSGAGGAAAAGAGADAKSAESKLAQAQALARQIAEKSDGAAGSSVVSAGGSTGSARPISNANTMSKVAAAAARASEINKRFFPQPAQPTSTVVELTGHYEDEIEINDFPQAARFRVTRREAVEELQAAAGVAITVRGVFVPPDKKGDLGTERKLYLLIEGTTQSAVTKAKQDIELILREELHRQATSYTPAPMGRQPQGRYKVLSLTN